MRCFLVFIAVFFCITLSAQTAIGPASRLFELAAADSTTEGKIKYLLQAVDLSDNCLPCKAQGHAELGLLFCEINNYQAGFLHLDTAIRLRRLQGDSVRVAGNFSNIAILKLEEGHHAQALSYALKGLKILEEIQENVNTPDIRDTLAVKNLATLSNTLSNIYSVFGNPEPGLQFAQNAKQLFLKLGDTLNYRDADFTLSNRYFDLFQETTNTVFADSAAYFYQQWLGFSKSQGDYYSDSEADVHHNLASLAIGTKDYSTARSEIRIAEHLYQDEENIAGLVDVEILKANIHIKDGYNYKAALANLRKARGYTGQTSIDTSVQLEICQLFSDCFDALGQTDSALFYSRMAEHLHVKMFNSQQKKFNDIDRSNLMETNELQRKHSRLELAKSREQQQLWASLAAILGLLIAIGALIWRQREQRQWLRISQQNQAIEDTLKAAQVRFLQGIIEGQELEREETKHILHNDIANSVLALSYEIDNSETIHPAQQSWVETLRQLASHTRRLSHQKGGIIHDVGIYEGVNDLLRRVGRTNLIETEFATNLKSRRLAATTEVEIWHIVQELVSNTLKYARATRIELSIEVDEKNLYITYQDNGIGFDLEQTFSQNKSIGLNSIMEKSHKLGGPTPEIITAPGKGFTISMEIPISKTELP